MPDALADHVVLVDIDAFDRRYLELADTPVIDALIESGSHGLATGVFKSFSNPARSTIITGAWPEVHGNQAYYYDPDRDRAIGQEHPYEDPSHENPVVTPLGAETVAQALAAEGRAVVGVEYRNLDRHGIAPDDPDHLLLTPGGDGDRRVDVAADVLRRRPPHLLALYLKDFDDLGHAESPDSPLMPKLVTRLDAQVGRLVDACAAAGIADRTVFVLVSDHGMVRIAEPILPELLTELDRTGLSWEVVREWNRPRTNADIVVMATSRNADLTLRGPARDAAADVVAAARRMGERVIVHERPALVELHATARIGDVVVEAIPPYHLGPDTDRPAGGGHGGSIEKDVQLIISGPPIRPGTEPHDAALVDVAPTICRLLGVRPPAQAGGRTLTELFHGGGQ